jgi:hypothetical protein
MDGVLSSSDLFQGNNRLDKRWSSNDWVSLDILSEPSVEGVNRSTISTRLEIELKISIETIDTETLFSSERED